MMADEDKPDVSEEAPEGPSGSDGSESDGSEVDRSEIDQQAGQPGGERGEQSAAGEGHAVPVTRGLALQRKWRCGVALLLGRSQSAHRTFRSI